MDIFSFGISRDLNAFLKTEDLDDLLKARSKLRHLSEYDEKKILSILEKWEKPQAVSNLLFNPTLIPEDIRISYLLKGLEEKKEPYYILAAVVGLQDIDAKKLLKEEKEEIKEHLILTLKTSHGVISARASISIRGFLSSSDSSRMFELLAHPDKTTRHNILSWLFKTIGDIDSEKFIVMANSSSIPEDVRKDAIEKFQEHVRQKAARKFSPFMGPLYAYIPNLRDT